MNDEELKQELNDLHLQLNQEMSESGKLDNETVASLKRIAGDIQRLLERQSGQDTPAPETDTDSLEAMAVGFEVEHPQLAALLTRFNYLLGNMGI